MINNKKGIGSCVCRKEPIPLRKIKIKMRVSIYAMAYAHSIGFDTAMCVGEYKGYPLYVCMYNATKEAKNPCIGLPQYIVIKDLKPIPLTLDETMEVIQRKKHRKRHKKKK